MNTRLKVFIGLAAAAAVVIGIVLGMTPMTTADGVGCGTAFDPASVSAIDGGRELAAAINGYRISGSAVEDCAGELEGRDTLAYVLIGLGALASGVWLWRPTAAASRPAA